MIGKKGVFESRLFFWIFDVLLLIVILGSAGYYFTANSDDTKFKQDFYARDIALVASEMLNTKGEIMVNYTLEEDFEVFVQNGNVAVLKRSLQEKYVGVPSRYSYAEMAGYGVESRLDDENNVLTLRKIERGDTV